MSHLGRRHWCGALAVAMLLHGFGAYWATQGRVTPSAAGGSAGRAMALGMTSLGASGASDLQVDDSGPASQSTVAPPTTASAMPTKTEAPTVEMPVQDIIQKLETPADQPVVDLVREVVAEVPLTSDSDAAPRVPRPVSVDIVVPNENLLEPTESPVAVQKAAFQVTPSPSSMVLPIQASPPPPQQDISLETQEPMVQLRPEIKTPPPIVEEAAARETPSATRMPKREEPIAKRQPEEATPPPTVTQMAVRQSSDVPKQESRPDTVAVLQPDAPPPAPAKERAEASESASKSGSGEVGAAAQTTGGESATAIASATGGGAQEGEAEHGLAGRGQGSGISGEDYLALIRDWLEHHKIYPRRARLRREEGTVVVRFILETDGRILTYSIEESSGSRLLDQEAEDLLQRAQPLPEIPAEMQESRLQLLVPIEFALR